jgi:hypothetical protein
VPRLKNKEKVEVVYIATGNENMYCMHSTEYVEYNGNEAVPSTGTYFLSVMLLSKKLE